MIDIDHVILVVPDLDIAAASIWNEYGLASVAGGRHSGHGTANRIVPFGETYIELMAVVDTSDAATSPMGRWAQDHTEERLIPAAVCLRVGDIAPLAHVLDEEPVAMQRIKPDGGVLTWHLAGLDGMLGPDNFPFFIEWHCRPEDHPAATAVDHRVGVKGITAVTIGEAPHLTGLLAEVEGLTARSGTGVLAVEIDTDGGLVRFD